MMKDNLFLFELRDQIEEAKTKVAGLKGKKEALLDSLQSEYGCKTIKEAKIKAEELTEEVSSLQKEIDKKLAKLEKKYDLP